MRRPSTRLILGLSAPVLVIVILLAAWGIDSSSASGGVPRNVKLGNRDISKLDEERLGATVADMADRYAEQVVQVRTPDRTYKVPAGDLGLALDQAATVRSALNIDQDTAVAARPFVWVGSFLDDRKAPLSFTVDTTTLNAAFEGLAGNAAATEPTLVASSNAMTVVSGFAGRVVDPTGVREQLLKAAEAGDDPLIVTARSSDRAPTITDAEAQAVADTANQAIGAGLQITAGGQAATIPAATVRTWLSSTVNPDGGFELTLDPEKAVLALAAAIPPTGQAKNASITLVGTTPTITPSQDGTTCCTLEAPGQILTAIKGGQNAVAVDLQVDKPAFTTEAAQMLGIKEPVGTTTDWKGQPQVKSFTTYFSCCAPRVTNIQRMADIVRGTLIKPGETFSVNKVVGERTEAKGFVAAGAISDGEHVDEVGGGVSQFATTMFNTAYFAGLDITVSQAHSEYFDRYPRGREATMGFPNPDLAWKNDTPYGILVWTSYTDTSLTITLYSTQYAYGEQTGSEESRSGNCTVVKTTRTIHYPDKANATDTFTARYRDSGQTTC